MSTKGLLCVCVCSRVEIYIEAYSAKGQWWMNTKAQSLWMDFQIYWWSKFAHHFSPTCVGPLYLEVVKVEYGFLKKTQNGMVYFQMIYTLYS